MYTQIIYLFIYLEIIYLTDIYNIQALTIEIIYICWHSICEIEVI